MVIHTIRQQSDIEGSISNLDLIGVDISQIEINNQRGSIRCRWVKCGQWFPHLDMLATHVTHTHAVAGNNGLFYCGWEGCSRGLRGFNARYKMLVHVRTHTNEKPHHCFQCDKSFSRAENLKIHARSHTGERPYVCPVPGCGKAYSNSSDRFKHTRTHSVDKPYVCKVPGCPKRYTDPSSLRKHVKTFRHFPAPIGVIHSSSPPSLPSVIGVESHIHSMEVDQNNTNLTVNPAEITAIPTTVILRTPLHAPYEDNKSSCTNLELPPTIEPTLHSMRSETPPITPMSTATKYLSTPGSQPFPAWPGFLHPWYDNSIIAWNTWQASHQYRHQNSFVMDMYDVNIDHNTHRTVSPVSPEDEQDRPLDLTVQAK